MTIQNLHAYEIFDSRGFPTIECKLTLENGAHVTASVPSGASVGALEALEKRDLDPKRLFGKGVLQAIAYINDVIAPKLIGQEIQALALDSIIMDLDTTPQKSDVGANTTLAVSMVIFKAHAVAHNMELYELIQSVSGTDKASMPTPMFNVINGGAHANNNLLIQEFMVIPDQTKNFEESLHAGITFYHHLKKIIDNQQLSTSVGDEGGFAPNLASDDAAFALLEQARKTAAQFTYVYGLDVAASELFDPMTQTYKWHTQLQPIAAMHQPIELKGQALQGLHTTRPQQYQTCTAQQLIDIYTNFAADFPLVSIEDGMSEDDITGWQELTKQLGEKMMLVGDDIFVTNPLKIRFGVAKKIANAVLIKPNQIGTVSQTLAAIDAAKNNGRTIVISHRSGETNDTFIADLAVGVAAQYIKAGAPCRGERLAKYNRLLEISRQLQR